MAGVEEASAAPEPAAAPKRESIGGVFGVSFGLTVAAIAIIVLVVIRGGSIDGNERVQELFGPDGPPYHLELQSAARLPTGDVVVRLAQGENRERGPAEVIFIEYASRDALGPLFAGDPEGAHGASGKLQAWKKDPTFDWKTTLERDDLEWGPWKTRFARVRLFEKGGKWKESARVDLSQPGRNLVLFAQWGDEESVDRDELTDLLRAIHLLPVEE